MYEIKAYKCDYCKKYSTNKSAIQKHEKICFYNPITRSCASCLYFGSTCAIRPEHTSKLQTNCADWITHPDYSEE